ncbi:orph-Q1 [Microplitis demolitor]|nr:orph-Q1 [Microplitis demolitor]
MILLGPYKYICYVPHEWNIFPLPVLETLVYKSIKRNKREMSELFGTTIDLAGVTTTVENYSLRLWMKKTLDKGNHPDPKKYFRILVES